MTRLLLKLFLRGQEGDTAAEHGAAGRLAGAVGIACNLLLFLGKLIAGLLTGSAAITADAVNNLSDGASSVVTLLGFRLARRPADRDHPYGHARYEYLTGLAVSAIILVACGMLAHSSLEEILHPEPLYFSTLTLGILTASVGVKLWMWRFFRALARRIGSTALEATAADSRNDAVATTGVLVSCLLGRAFGWAIDGYVSLAVSAFILYSGVRLARETISPLLGERADPALVENLTALILAHTGVLGLHDLLIHDYGPGQCFASVHVEVDGTQNPMVSHDLLDEIEQEALERLNVHLVIHDDPVLVNDREWNDLRTTVEELLKEFAPELTMHDFRIVREGGQRRLSFDLEAPYGLEVSAPALRERLEEALAARGMPWDITLRLDRGE